MTTINFEQFYQDLQSNIEQLAKNSLKDFEKQAMNDGQQLLNQLKESLQRWAEEVETGVMNKEDLEFLLQGEKSLDEMIALKQAGLASIRIDSFKNEIVNLILGTISSSVKI